MKEWPFFGLEDEICEQFYEVTGGRFTYKPKGLLLYGPSAAGKTVAAWLAIRSTWAEWDSISCWRAAQLGRAITSASRGDDEELATLTHRLRTTELLYIDDIDKARFTPRVQSEVFDFIEAHDIEARPMIVTTNTTSGPELAAKFDKAVGPAIVNRLLRLCHEVDFGPLDFDYDEELARTHAEVRERVAVQLEIARERMARIQEQVVTVTTSTPAPSTLPVERGRFAAMRAALNTLPYDSKPATGRAEPHTPPPHRFSRPGGHSGDANHPRFPLATDKKTI